MSVRAVLLPMVLALAVCASDAYASPPVADGAASHATCSRRGILARSRLLFVYRHPRTDTSYGTTTVFWRTCGRSRHGLLTVRIVCDGTTLMRGALVPGKAGERGEVRADLTPGTAAYRAWRGGCSRLTFRAAPFHV